MLRQRVVLRKTRRGNVVKLCREHYLRDDIPCGLPTCTKCKLLPSSPTLSTDPRSNFHRPHYLLISTYVAYHQIDVLEHAAMSNYILPHTVLSSVREKSLPIYNRLRAISSDFSRNVIVFANEFHRDTYVDRNPGEKIEEKQERSVRVCAKWFQQHWKAIGKEVGVVLLVNSEDEKAKAQSEGIEAALLSEYVESLKNEAPELVDMVAETDVDATETAKFEYPEYLPLHQCQAGLKNGLYYQGKISISTHNLFEGSIFATIDGQEQTIKVIGREHLNRSIHDDIVVVEPLPRSQWTQVSESVALDEDEDDTKTDENAMTIDTSENTMDVDASDAQPLGRVVGIIRRNWRAYCGTIDSSSLSSTSSTNLAQNVWFYPVDQHIPRIRIRTRQANALVGHRIIVSIDGWDKTSKYPRGHFVKNLGKCADRSTEVDVLLLEHDVPFQPFSQDVLACLPKEGDQWVVTEEHESGRMDYRNLEICSIDPPGCTDIDDALHCRLLPNGNFEVGVHIADVTHFVKPGMPMDQEAARRSTTVYLVDKRIDMLPPLLGTNLCSLRSNVDRLAFSCVWELTPEAEIINTTFSKSIIRSKASLTYGEAQSRIDDPKMTDSLTQSIRKLNELSKKLRKRRTEAGSLTLSSPEVRFQLEHDSQDPVDVELKELKETNALVEDFMLLANISVAKKIFEKFPESAVLRRHPKPPQTSFDNLKKALAAYNLTLHPESNKTLSDSLDLATLKNDPYFNKLVRIMTTRCMMQAIYFCSGSISDIEFQHYGLATPIYTHFTSPIRRYADVMVHRLLAASVDQDVMVPPELLDRVKVTELTENMNYRHRMAQHASRSSVELYTNLFFRGKVVQEPGYVTRILKNGFSVLVPKYGIEGFVYASASSSTTSPFAYDSVEGTLKYGDITLRAFSNVKIQISIDESSIAGLRQRLRMSLVDPVVPGLSVPELEKNKA